MPGRPVIVASFSLLLVLLPVTAWMHQQAAAIKWPTAEGKIVDVRLERQPVRGDKYRAPGDEIHAYPIAEYPVDGETYRRHLPSRTIQASAHRDHQAIRLSLINSPVTLSYQPEAPAQPPPIHWRWWTAWLLTAACVGCLVPWIMVAAQNALDRISPVQRSTGPRRRVLSASEYRAMNE